MFLLLFTPYFRSIHCSSSGGVAKTLINSPTRSTCARSEDQLASFSFGSWHKPLKPSMMYLYFYPILWNLDKNEVPTTSHDAQIRPVQARRGEARRCTAILPRL